MPVPKHLRGLPQPVPSAARLDAVRLQAQAFRDLELEISELEQRLKTKKDALTAMQRETLPDLMDLAGIDRLGLPAHGNHPGADLQLKPFFSANIAADWEPSRRRAGFQALERCGAADLIKNIIEVQLPRGNAQQAVLVKGLLEQNEVAYTTKESVPFQTLTAWLKEQYEVGGKLPPLDQIGAIIGRTVKLKERKE